MRDERRFEGGCFCRAVRYRFVGVFDAGYCHCSICRRSTGAPAVAWVNTPLDGFAFTHGSPRSMRSSPTSYRQFCGDCGTQLLTRTVDEAAWPYVSLHHGTIDDADTIRPQVHLCLAERLHWFDIADDLPRAPDNALPHPDRRSPPC